MGFLSQSGHVGIKTQAAKGAYLDPGAADPDNGVFIRVRSGALGGNRELLIPDPEIGGTRDISDAQLGPINFMGEYDMYLRCEAAATLLAAAFGDVVDSDPGTAGDSGYLHTITPATTLPWLSVEEKIGDGYEAFEYTDCKVNTFHMEADADGYLTATAGLIGLTQSLEASPTAPASQVVDTSPLIVGTLISVDWGGVALPAKSFSFDINNNLEDDDFRLGSIYLGDLTEKRREITMSVTIRPEDSDLWRTALWGDPAATSPGCASYKDDVLITINTCEDIPAPAVSTQYEITVAVPQAAIQPFELSPSGDDVFEHDLEIQALQPDPSVDIATVTVLNSFATTV